MHVKSMSVWRFAPALWVSVTVAAGFENAKIYAATRIHSKEGTKAYQVQ